MLGVELWADTGLRESGTTNAPSVHKQAVDVPDEGFTTDVVEALIRAAYSVGYYQAMTDPDPLTYADAMTRRDQLMLALPVG